MTSQIDLTQFYDIMICNLFFNSNSGIPNPEKKIMEKYRINKLIFIMKKKRKE